jgi:hypothetical protein
MILAGIHFARPPIRAFGGDVYIIEIHSNTILYTVYGIFTAVHFSLKLIFGQPDFVACAL